MNYIENLRKIKNELKVNAASVPCDVGGGNHGHLGLIMTTVEYAYVDPTSYMRPIHPGILVITPGMTQYNATIPREQHKEDL